MQLGHASKGTARLDHDRWRAWAANLVGLVVVLWILYPVYFHAFVWRPVPSLQVVTDLRSTPDDATLAELDAHLHLGPDLPADGAALALADSWLAASRDPAASGRHPIVMQLTAADLVRDQGVGALPFSSLYGADVLVRAYRANGNPLYLSTARELILGFARYERSAWRDRGFLWNDHAIAARVGVIIRFWASYRSHALFDADDAAEILQHAARSAALLAAPSHFTAWSNHGVMQNVALLQLAAAFPGLIDSGGVSRLAMDRLTMQWRYYISDEGVILEHSSGYHIMGRSFLVTAVKLAEMNGLNAPATWREQLRKSGVFLDRLTRPDRTQPAFGDTHVQVPLAPARPPQASGGETHGELSLYALSGYAIWTASDSGGRTTSHSAATWSNFPRHAHKLADDLGLAVWAGGRGWITPSGYAPYGSEFRARIEGWLGSNAPHGYGESAEAGRRSELLGSSASSSTVLLDIRRRAASGEGFRRQVVSLAGGRWLVLDQALGAVPWPATETLWTFYPDLGVEEQGDGRFLVRSTQGQTMVATVVSGGGSRGRVTTHRGSRDPFAGWVATERGMLAAPALRVVAAAQGWTATLFDFAPVAGAFEMQFTDGERWQASGPDWHVHREGARIESLVDDRHQTSQIMAPPDTHEASVVIESSLAATLKAYPKYRNVDAYRLRVAALLATVWLLQILVFLAARTELARRGWSTAGQILVVLSWIGVAVWLGAVYFGD